MSAYAPQKDAEVRRSGLGSSDCAPIVGVRAYGRDRHRVWLEKVGQAAPLIETENMQLGDWLEDPIAKYWAARTSARVRRHRATVRKPGKPFLFTHVDRVVVPEGATVPRLDAVTELLEVKNAGPYRAHEFGEKGSDQVPPEFHLQATHSMMVMPAVRRVHFAVLQGGTGFWYGTVERDEPLIADVEAIETAFWLENVVPRIPPELDGSDGANESLQTRFPVDDGTILELDEEIGEAVRELRSARAAIVDLEARRALYEQRIKDRMGDHAYLEQNGRRIATWKSAAGAIGWKGIAEALRPKDDDRWERLIEEHRGSATRRFVLSQDKENAA